MNPLRASSMGNELQYAGSPLVTVLSALPSRLYRGF